MNMQYFRFHFPISSALIVVFFFTSCKNPQQEAGGQNSPDPAATASGVHRPSEDCIKLKREALRLDSVLLGQTEVDVPSATDATKAFTDYAYYCHNDTTSPVYLIKAAQVARAINNFQQAKLVLEVCIKDYPRFKNRAAALFLLAQLYDEDTYLNNENEARRLYEQIIGEYPGSDWAVSAKGAIRFLGKSDEEIIRELKKKQ
jgi:hypothetical protein